MKHIVLIISFGFVSLFASNLNVTVSILPLKYFVEKIAQDRVDINVMVKPGFSPHNFEPKTSQMKKISKSQIYYSLGLSFEKTWINRFKSANKNLNIVDVSKGVKKVEMISHNHHHDHHHDEHSETLDPHIWLDPILAKKISENIYESLLMHDEKNAEFYKHNYEVLLNELTMLNLDLNKILKNNNGSSFMVFHPSWGYFAKRYNLHQVAVEIEGKEPKVSQLMNIIKKAKNDNVKVIFTSPQFSKKSAKVIASNINANVVEIDSLSYDYQINLIKTANAISKAFD